MGMNFCDNEKFTKIVKFFYSRKISSHAVQYVTNSHYHHCYLTTPLSPSSTLIELVKEREQRKYDCALIQAEIFRKRYLLQDWSGSLISSLKPHGASTSTRRLSTPDNKWDNKGIIMKVEP